MVTIQALETQADEYARSWATFDWRNYTPRAGRLHQRIARQSALALYKLAHDRTRNAKRKRRYELRMKEQMFYLLHYFSSQRFALEHRARRREDVEAWESQGWRVLDWKDSYTHATSTAPLYEAERSARWVMEALTPLGYTLRLETMEYLCTTGYDWYGRSFSVQSGKVVILVKAETPMDVELARRVYKAHQAEYWGKHWPDSTIDLTPRFREWV